MVKEPISGQLVLHSFLFKLSIMNSERDGGSDFRDRGRKVGLAKLLLVAAPFVVVLARLASCNQRLEEEQIFDFELPPSESTCAQVMEYIRSQDKFSDGEFAQIGPYAVDFSPDDNTVNGWILVDAKTQPEFEELASDFLDQAYWYFLNAGLEPDYEVRLVLNAGRIEEGTLIVNENLRKVTGPASGC